jgi:predicted DCC family thiol-disulfide oxidoreductase YuxK
MTTADKPVLPLTVYYDRSCPLCATEMHALRDLDPKGFRLVDCSAPDFADAMRDDMMARMHARGADGRWLTGLDAFEAIYAAAGMKRTSRLWGNRRLRPLFDRMYAWIARNRQALSRLGLHRVVGLLLGRRATSAPPSPRA